MDLKYIHFILGSAVQIAGALGDTGERCKRNETETKRQDGHPGKQEVYRIARIPLTIPREGVSFAYPQTDFFPRAGNTELRISVLPSLIGAIFLSACRMRENC